MFLKNNSVSTWSGMFQRLDKLRKNAFASVLLFGSNNDSSISGIWIFRGQDLAFTVSIKCKHGFHKCPHRTTDLRE